jgi:hypothetical protein
VTAYLGNYGHESSVELPQGFAVQKRALKREPWVFGKTLYLAASGMKLQAINGDAYHNQVELFHSLVCVALPWEGQWFAYIVVEASKDQRFKYFPVLVGQKESFV